MPIRSFPIKSIWEGFMEYDTKKAEECIRKASLGERYQSMPEGLETDLYKDVSEKGVSISGGEAQK